MFLKQSMNEKGLSQREFAKQIGMKESQLSLILNTERNITAETISRLYWAFRCRPRVAIREEEFVADNLIADNMISFPVKSATTPSEGFINSMTVETKYINSCEVAHG